MRKVLVVATIVLLCLVVFVPAASAAPADSTATAPCEFWLPGVVCAIIGDPDGTIQDILEEIIPLYDRLTAYGRCVLSAILSGGDPTAC